jgi:hypothetical protein
MSNISLEGLNKADVLAALYNASRPQGLGFASYDPTPMTSEQAQAILGKGHMYFDYLAGRVMKIELGGGELDPWGYDRDNGNGQAAKVINELRTSSNPNSDAIQATHSKGKVAAAEETFEHLGDKSGPVVNQGDIATYGIGLDDVADKLRPHIHRSLGR